MISRPADSQDRFFTIFRGSSPFAMYFRPLAFALCLLSAPVSAETSYQHLERQLTKILTETDWGEGRLVLKVVDLEHHLPVIRHNNQRPIMPGSVVKFATAMAALDMLGSEYRFTSELYMQGEIDKRWFRKDVLRGNLLVVGDGDPTMTSLRGMPEDSFSVFDRWSGALRDLGIGRVEGKIYLDDSAFDADPFAPGWPKDRIGEARLPEVSALNFNENTIEIFWKPSKKADRTASYDHFPPIEETFISNNVKVSDRPRPRTIRRGANSRIIELSGTLPFNTSYSERASVQDPTTFFGEALAYRLRKNKVGFEGEIERKSLAAVRAEYETAKAAQEAAFVVIEMEDEAGEEEEEEQDKEQEQEQEQDNDKDKDKDKESESEEDGVESAGFEPVLVDRIDSAPVAEIVQQMLTHNLSLHSEVLFKAIGRKESGKPGGFESGASAVRAYLRRIGMTAESIHIVDGSGMSVLNRMDADQIMDLMAVAYRHRHGNLIFDSLPRSGQPGALEGSFLPGVVEAASEAPEIRAAGLLDQLPGGLIFAGWVQTRAGHPLYVVFSVEGSRLDPAELKLRSEVLLSEISTSFIQ